MNKNAKKSKQLQSIKKKLTAATAMLLVASTMMVSSTYAWFTLSTAPEVTGISTTVGANGSLEIALANNTADASLVKSTVGDSFTEDEAFATRNAKNMTWGNLVDLSSVEYGLEEIVLLPASLNTETSTTTSGENTTTVTKVKTGNPLSFPIYGADGRVDELSSNTVTAKYLNSEWVTNSETTTNYGVRAIGSMSGQSETTVAFRDARSKLAEYAQSAKSTATNTLQTNGGALGNIIVDKVLKDSPTFTEEQVTSIGGMITGLQTALTYIDDAIQYAALGRAASSEFSDTTMYEAIDAAIKAPNATALSVLKVFYPDLTETDAEITRNNTKISYKTISATDVNSKLLIEAYNKYAETVACVADAADKYENLTPNGTDGAYLWNDISPVVNALVDADKVKVNGMTSSEIKADMNAFVDKVTSNGNNVVVSMYTGSGVIADIADLAGDYSAGITIAEISYAGLNLKNFKATMNTKSSVVPDHLSANSTYILSKGAMSASAEGNSEGTFTDTYGYIVDLFFRTNVVGSNLQLQTKPVDRVYTDESVEGAATMGSGSTMTFTTTNEQVFNRNQMMDLMNCIRLVFIGQDGTILKYAALDADAAQQTETTTATGTAVTLEANIYTADATGAFLGKGDYATLTSLTQNEAKLVSVLVYLDGSKVDNTMVANAATSMTGSLNLQFSSSANLVPMDNNQIRDLAESKEEADKTYAVSTGAATVAADNTQTAITSGVTLAANPTSAKKGDTVTLTLTETTVPEGYAFNSIKVFNGTTLTSITPKAGDTEGTYTFTMPAYDTSVIAVYTAATT